MGGWRRRKKIKSEIHPEDILADAQNLGDFDRDQFEGRIERPLNWKSFAAAGTVVALCGVALLARAATLQVVEGAAYAKQAEENQLAQTTIIADRGAIEDRTGRPLAWSSRAAVTDDFADRMYSTFRGLAHAVGYAKAPAKDSAGFYFRDSYEGKDGAELAYDAQLGGVNGLKLTETNARGAVVSESTVRAPQAGATLRLSLDAQVTQGLFDVLAGRAEPAHAQGAAGVIMDVRTGELLAMTSYPEYSAQAMVDGTASAIDAYNADKRLPFLDRAIDGLYAPGSIVKPAMAVAALSEGVIDEHKQILSTGKLVVPNPYNPDLPSIFKDWRVNGWVDARKAIAVSCDIYFYEVGGGFGDQPGLGIERIDKYLKMFGLGVEAGLAGFSTKAGNIPSPAWKAANFPEDPTWRLGNTYHTSIGQYGVQVTPLQAVRMAAALANGGTLLDPSLIASTTPQGVKIDADPHAFVVAQEGMRQGVTDGIATAVNFPFVKVAAKTGTAQIGAHNEYQNAWMIGFWPYDHPHYAYAVVLERLPAGTPIGGSAVMYDFFRWLNDNAPQYLE